MLEPRAWTAAQSRWAAELAAAAPDGPMLELCAGAGHIGLLAVALTGRPLVCVDLNPVACDFARHNAAAAGLAHLVEVREGRLEEAVGADERFAVVIADPPWVPRAETGRFPEDPLIAIDGGDDGLDVARACVAVADRHLLPGGFGGAAARHPATRPRGSATACSTWACSAARSAPASAACCCASTAPDRRPVAG